MNSCNFTNKANLHTPKVEIHTRQKICYLAAMLRKLFCLKCFIPATRAGVFIWENFHPVYRDLGRKNRDFGNRASQASRMNTWNFLRRKEWWGEISETEPARAHMKRTLIMI